MNIVFEARNGVVWDAEPSSLLRFLSERSILAAVDLDSDGETVFRLGVDENGLTAAPRNYGGLGVGVHVDALAQLLRQNGFDVTIDGVPEVRGDDEDFFEEQTQDTVPFDERADETVSLEPRVDEREAEVLVPRSALASRLGQAWAPLLANKLHTDVEIAIVSGWSIMRFDDPTFSEVPSVFVNRRELPLIRLFRGDIDVIVIQLSSLSVRTGHAATVTLVPSADAGMVPSVELSTLDQEGTDLMRRLLSSVRDVADVLEEHRTVNEALELDRDALALSLAPRSIGGFADPDSRTRAALLAVGLPVEVVEAMVAAERPAGSRIVRPAGLASAVERAMVGPASDLSAVGSRPPLWARMDDFLRLHLRTAIAVAIAQILVGAALVIVGVTVGRPIPLICGTVIVGFGALSLTVSARRTRSRSR